MKKPVSILLLRERFRGSTVLSTRASFMVSEAETLEGRLSFPTMRKSQNLSESVNGQVLKDSFYSDPELEGVNGV